MKDDGYITGLSSFLSTLQWHCGLMARKTKAGIYLRDFK
ncbi:hypothetical protein XSR1_200015 [Xenorhabdus szentirmaii DSM 16338]|uniref:Uncharacterized protein n=1 Tax=Xenorhabdus szentirmaii DSM 16338 TaxID=1427518 RepID=W1IVN2_9GAMM|nr:hypothetical protein XSR1_200015 [Xenorhabdus szentirmaii DSM 16338]